MSHTAIAHLATQMRVKDAEYREAITNLALTMVNAEPIHPRPVGVYRIWRAVSGRKPL